MDLIVKSFNGIGDLLFLTPSLRVIKESYPDARIMVNTNFPTLLHHNPYVDNVGGFDEGLFLGYDDPIHRKPPTKHNIIADWEIICKHYNLTTSPPALKPEIYVKRLLNAPNGHPKEIGVQAHFKGTFSGKKIWPLFLQFAQDAVSFQGGMVRQIPWFNSIRELVRFIGQLRAVVCEEGGIAHIARALGIPAVVVYGGFSRPEWNGYSENENLCFYPQECGPCFIPDPCTHPTGDKYCMNQITQVDVLAALKSLLGE